MWIRVINEQCEHIGRIWPYQVSGRISRFIVGMSESKAEKLANEVALW
jgi:hypothetical protein